METMHAPGRRRLPPVPRAGVELRPAPRTGVLSPIVLPDTPSTDGAETERFSLPPATGEQQAQGRRSPTPDVPREPAPTIPPTDTADRVESGPVPVPADPEFDAAQRFVARLRAAAADFAEAAGATSAVVAEAVPPARHRRCRCRVVLRYPDDSEADLTFLGSTGAPPAASSRHGFDRQIRRWLASGQRRDGAWLVPDPDARDGVAVDVSAWLAAG
jgi:hypothetical protein